MIRSAGILQKGQMLINQLNQRVHGLHCYKKKSTKGIETPKQDVDLIRERLKAAQAHAKGA